MRHLGWLGLAVCVHPSLSVVHASCLKTEQWTALPRTYSLILSSIHMDSFIKLSQHNISCLLSSPDGSVIISWCESHHARLIMQNTLSSLSALGNDGLIRFYRWKCATEIRSVPCRKAIVSMCWAKGPHAQPVLACLCADGNVRLWQVDDYFPAPDLSELIVNAGNVGGIPAQGGIVTSDTEGTQLAIGSPGRLTVWNLESQGNTASCRLLAGCCSRKL